MSDYIEITRHFIELKAELDAHPDWIPRPGGPLTWSRILLPAQGEHIVLLAPSGYGKSTEIFEETRRQRAIGVHAIAADAAAITEDGLRAGLDADNREALNSWLKTTGPAILFVDAVDELALRRKDLRDLLRKLDSGISFDQRTVQVVVTARTGMWLPEHTERLQRFLQGGGKKPPLIRKITFMRLSEAALRALAIGNGVSDVDAFITCLRREEVASLFDVRPRDVRWLVHKWNQSGRLGKWSELLSDYCDAALEDETPDRALQRVMSVRDGHLGLQRTAAGMLFGKRAFISVPAVERSAQTISSRRLFDDWVTAKVQNLLETALFVHKGMDGQAVQLAADTLMPFLTARWLAERARAGLGIEELRELVMVRAFGEREFHIPPSRIKLSGWLASELPEFRALLLEHRPEVVLFDGDPDRLTDRELEHGLLAFGDKLLADARAVERTPREGTLRKLARPSLETVALSLLSTRPATPSAQMLALQLVQYGRYSTCVPLVLPLALDAAVDSYIRQKAIAAVTEAGDAAERDQLIPLTTDPLLGIRIELLKLVPDTIRGQDLVRLMRDGGDLEFRIHVRRMADKIAKVDLDAILIALEPTLGRTIVDVDTEPAFCVALPIVTEAISRGMSTATIISILGAIDRLLDYHTVFVSEEELEELRRALASNTACRRALLQARLADGVATPYGMRTAQFGQAVFEDLPWLGELWNKSMRRERRRNDAKKQTKKGSLHPRSRQAPSLQRSNLIARLVDDLYRRLPSENQALARMQIPNELLAGIDEWTKSTQQLERQRARNAVQRERKAAASRAKKAQLLQPRIRQIESGDDDALIIGWHYLGREHGKRARRDFSRLAAEVGEALVPVFVRGFKAFWRRRAVLIPDPSSQSTDLRDLIGLTGLTLDIDDGLDLRTLSPNEARLAATYALYELNEFPFWFEDLLGVQPVVVEQVLREMFARIWGMNAEKLSQLRFGPYVAKPVASLMRTIILDLAESGRPVSRKALEEGIDTLLTSANDPLRVTRIANAGIALDSNDEARLAQWLRLLAHVDPIAAADHFELMRTADVPRYERVLEIVASSLEKDLSDRYRMSIVSAMLSPPALGAWLRLSLLGVAPERDTRHPEGEMHLVGQRDYAQRFRDGCLNLLRQNVTEEAHRVLAALAADPTVSAYHYALVPAIEYQLEVARDAIARAWSEDEVLSVERGDERSPQTLDDLFGLLRSHIAHIDRLISKDEFSYRDLFSAHTDERKIQLWVASNLRERARGLYSVARENVVDDDKEVDISVLAADVQVPIEIKPLGPYSPQDLKEVIADQLLGKYMRAPERRCGVLLLVRRERTRWRIRGRLCGLDELVVTLQEYATVIGQRHGKTIAVEVIDLLEKTGSSSLERKRRTHTAR